MIAVTTCFALISFIEGVGTVVMIDCADKVIEQHMYGNY